MHSYLFLKREKELNEVTEKMGTATPEELEELLEQMAEIQDRLKQVAFIC